MTAVAFFLYFLSAVGLVLLILSVRALVAPFVGWRFSYDAVPQAAVAIPRAGRYAVCVSHDRWHLSREAVRNQAGGLVDLFSAADFSVVRAGSNEPVPYCRVVGVENKGASRVTMTKGYFDAPAPGEYVVTDVSAYRFSPGDQILLRGYLSVGKLVGLTLGIVGSAGLLVGGATVASVML